MIRFSERIFAWLLVLLIVLNFTDAFCTLYWIAEGFATEANPLMKKWLQISDKAFIFIKMFIAVMSSVLLWIARKNKLAHILVFLIILLYAYVLIIHLDIALKVFFN